MTSLGLWSRGVPFLTGKKETEKATVKEVLRESLSPDAQHSPDAQRKSTVPGDVARNGA